MKKTIAFIACFFILAICYSQTSADKSLKVTVTTNASPLSFTFRWQKGLNAASYSVSRKKRNDTLWTILTNTLGVNDTFYVDNNVASSIAYEYKIKASSNIIPFNEYTYLYCSNNFPAKHQQGKIILLVDSNYTSPLVNEIKRLENDLTGEGWTIIRKDIRRDQSINFVKQFIVKSYLTDSSKVKGIFILGHIPVPYSGLIYPDGHDDHYGAWSTDAYYCDTSFKYWTDISVNNTTALRAVNQNIPGDGKFDQNFVDTNDIKLFSGRVDFLNMPDINTNDTLLIKQYLDKDHNYRIATTKFRMRGLIDDGFGYFGGEAFAQNGWRNFCTLLSPDSVFTGEYSTDMVSNSYLWSYGCGGGSFESAAGIGSTSSLKNANLQSVFTMLFGSYFGDWDSRNNFLKAPLASSSSMLVNCWAGRPNWFFHHMALGEPIGLDAYETFKNAEIYLPNIYGTQMVHATLLGDPTLRMYVYEPPTNLSLITINNNTAAKLNWNASASNGVLGYYVYRSRSLTDTFTLLTPSYITTTTYNDLTAPVGKNIYLVRAVKLQVSATGSFYNLSGGPIDSINILSTVPISLNYFKGEKTLTGNTLHWFANCPSNSIKMELQKSIDDVNFSNIYTTTADNIRCQQPFDFTDAQNVIGTSYYRVKLTDIDGKITYSSIVALNNIEKNGIALKSTPVLINNDIVFNITASGKSVLDATITDASGKLIKKNAITITEGDNQLKINCGSLATGIYNFNCFYKKQLVCVSRFIK